MTVFFFLDLEKCKVLIGEAECEESQTLALTAPIIALLKIEFIQCPVCFGS